MQYYLDFMSYLHSTYLHSSKITYFQPEENVRDFVTQHICLARAGGHDDDMIMMIMILYGDFTNH